MHSLLDGITHSHVRHDPFPHIFIRDVLDQATVRALGDGFPPFSKIGWSGGKAPRSNHRFQLSAWQITEFANLSPTWNEFVSRHASPEFYAQVVALFHDFWPPALTEALGGSLLGHSTGWLMRDHFDKRRILQDARIEINTPVTGPPSSSRGPHLDMPNRLYSGLLYLRADDDDSEGGELELFRWRSGPVANTEAYELPADAVEVVARIPYRANQLVMFPQNINAIHGVGIRQPTPHTRRYVFITVEIAEPWLKSPTAHTW